MYGQRLQGSHLAKAGIEAHLRANLYALLLPKLPALGQPRRSAIPDPLTVPLCYVLVLQIEAGIEQIAHADDSAGGYIVMCCVTVYISSRNKHSLYLQAFPPSGHVMYCTFLQTGFWPRQAIFSQVSPRSTQPSLLL